MKIKLDGQQQDDKEIFLYLKDCVEGIRLGAKNSRGVHMYDILTIKEQGVHFHNLKNFVNRTPFPLVDTDFDRTDSEAKRIKITRQ